MNIKKILTFFKKKKLDIKNNDPENLYKIILFFKDFFKDKNLIKNKKLLYTLPSASNNIIKYIQINDEIIKKQKYEKISDIIYNYNLYKYNIKAFISDDDKKIIINHMDYLNIFIEQLIFLEELFYNETMYREYSEKSINSKMIYRYIIHMLNILRDIYNTYKS